MILFLYFLPFTSSSHEEFRLLADLRKNYDPFERPVQNSSEPLVVSVKIYLQQILDVDEKNQVITIVAWIKYTWTDYKLKWDPGEYGGIKDIRFPGTANAIWKPDVLLYNSADENFDSTYPVNYVVSHDGSIMQVPPGILKLSCKIDITWFPFDTQKCHLKYGSWTYSGNFIDLRIEAPDGKKIEDEGMDMSYYVENGEWTLLGVPARNESYVFDNEPYPSIYFYILIQRRTLYYGLNLIVPSLLISLMTVLGFTLPPDAGEKITLEITILLSICFFLSMVAEMTPPTSEAVPLIGAYFSSCMLVVSASVVFTVLVLNLHHRRPETHEMSPFMRTCFLIWLPWLLMMRRPGNISFNRHQICVQRAEIKARKLDSQNQSRKVSVFDNKMTTSFLRNIRTLKHEDSCTCSQRISRHGVLATLKARSLEYNDLQETSIFSTLNKGVQKACTELKTISNQIRVMRKRVEDDEREEHAANDWKFAAMVVDRLCLFTFTIFIVVSTCGIMFSSPHLIA
ncbi:unnamed protein product, partial [Mesorhabditis belari]|uniref:Uncharacterized protein n=1 Tax=Mesorhabditis belari TaxID=2138241 RepID=A0AAF3FLJ5_9BILA